MQEKSHSNPHLSKVFTHHQHCKSFHAAGNYKSTHHVRCIFCDGHVRTILALIFVKYKQNIQCSSLASHTTLSHTHTQTPAKRACTVFESRAWAISSHKWTQQDRLWIALWPARLSLTQTVPSRIDWITFQCVKLSSHTSWSQQDRLNNLSLHQAVLSQTIPAG